MRLEAIRNHIIFKFIDRVTSKGEFEEAKSKGGLIIQSGVDSSASSPRWVKIVSLGPDCCEEIRIPDCELLVENLKWTKGVNFNGSMVWRTDETKVLAYRFPDGADISTAGV